MNDTPENLRIINARALQDGLNRISEQVRQNTKTTDALRRDMGTSLNTFADAVLEEIRQAASEAAEKIREAGQVASLSEAAAPPFSHSLAAADKMTADAKATLAHAEKEAARKRESAELVVSQAQTQAAKILAEARLDAENITANALDHAEKTKAQADAALAEAKAEADKMAQERAENAEPDLEALSQRETEHARALGTQIVNEMRQAAEAEIADMKKAAQTETPASAAVARTPVEARLLEALKRFAYKHGEEIVSAGMDPETNEEEAIEAFDSILMRLAPPANPLTTISGQQNTRAG